jgi:hypothetical protein
MRYSVIVAAMFAVIAPALLAGQTHDDGLPSSKKFTSIKCFAGEVRVDGKRLTFQSYEVVLSSEKGECCGGVVRKGKTDQHGHFVIEPLQAGTYYAKFNSRGREDIVGFRVSSYDKCRGGHVEIKFLPDGTSTIQQYLDLDVDMSDCDPEQASCFRR